MWAGRLLTLLLYLSASLAQAAIDALAIATATDAWEKAVVDDSDPAAVASLFCEDGVLMATAGQGLRYQKFSDNGMGALKPNGTTIESYFDWFAKLKGQKITDSHDNIQKITTEVWVNNAWVTWVWEGNPGLVARMTFIFREDSTAASGLCLFELHSSALPEKTGDEEETAPQEAVDSSGSSGSSASSAGSSASLGSLGSAAGKSLNTGSSASDPSNSGSSSSTASGSWGSALQTWQWLLLLTLCCCCMGGGGAASSMSGKKKKKKSQRPDRAPMAAAPVAVPEPQPVVEVLPTVEEPVVDVGLFVPPLLPLPTSSSTIPSFAKPASQATFSNPYSAPAVPVQKGLSQAPRMVSTPAQQATALNFAGIGLGSAVSGSPTVSQRVSLARPSSTPLLKK